MQDQNIAAKGNFHCGEDQMRSLKFELFADYFKFYLQDEAANGDLSDSWSDEAVARLLVVAPGIVGIGTVRNMIVPVLLEIHDQEPALDLSDWDQVVECGLEAGSGRIIVAGSMDYLPDAARVELAAGAYRVRASYGALDSLSADGLDGADHYRVQLWPGAPVAPSIVKQRIAAR